MKCSRKDSFVYVLLTIFIMTINGERLSWSSHDSPLRQEGISFPKFKATRDVYQISDQFPNVENSDVKLHKIVKKQMAISDNIGRDKRSVIKGCDARGVKCKSDAKFVTTIHDYGFAKRSTDRGTFKTLNKVEIKELSDSELVQKRFPSKRTKRDEALFDKKEESKQNDEKMETGKSEKHENPKNLKNLVDRPCDRYVRYPDKTDSHFYYECEVERDGCLKLKRKKCPDGELFSSKYLECLRASYLQVIRQKRGSVPAYPRKLDVPDPNSDVEPEPANEWLDASQGSGQKIPSEFKPKRKPKLRIYHLRSKRKFDKRKTEEDGIRKRHSFNFGMGSEGLRKPMKPARVKGHGIRHHHPRSFLIRINKKQRKDNQEESIREDDETENEEDEESEDEEDDEDGEEEDDESEDEDQNDEETKTDSEKSRKEPLKELFKSAKAAVTNKVKFNDGPSDLSYNNNVHKSSYSNTPKSDRSNVAPNTYDKSKKVLIDANIKVDGAISNALRNILSKRKEKSIANGNGRVVGSELTRNSENQINPESIKMYENLIKSDPAAKRHLL